MGYRSLISIAAVLVIAVFAAIPQTTWSSLPPVCAFRNLLGVECFGCGMTRALSAAAHGHLKEAISLNEGVLVVAPLLLAMALQRLWPFR
jgi:hypothetical protein